MRRPVALALAAALVLALDVVALAVIDDGDRRRPEWPPGVADIAAFVERERGLRFERAVAVEFLSDADYAKAASGEGDTTPGDAETAARKDYEAVLRAIGLVPRDGDLGTASAELVGEGTLAFYDPQRRRVVVRGTEMDAAVRVTLAHELTHALQDQHFDIGRAFDSDGEATAFRALLEGDADRIEALYVENLGPDEQDAWERRTQEFDPTSDLASVPPAIIQVFAAPYALGDPLVDLLVEARGVQGVDDAIRSPPQSEEALFDPFSFLGGTSAGAVRAVAPPKPGRGEKQIDGGDFGSVTWFVMLASHLDDRRALRAVDGWGGDAYVAYKSGRKTCVRARFVGDTALDVEEMAQALGEWRDAFPPGMVSVSRGRGRVEFRACDSGGAIPPPLPSLSQALVVPASRTAFATQLLRNNVPEDLARCTAHRVVAAFTTEQLAARELPRGAPDPARVGLEASRACLTERSRRG